MSTFELNKIIGAILLVTLVTTVIGMISDGLVKTREGGGGARVEAGRTPAAAPAEAPKGPGPIVQLLAAASAKQGEKDARICGTCHNFKEGQGKKIGPDLWNVVGRDIASKAGFDYSGALKSKKGKWTYGELNHWLWKPSAFAHGTKMTFAGLPGDKKRADVIKYLRSLSDHPQPLPSPEEVKAATAKAAQPASAKAAPKQGQPAASGGQAASPAAQKPGGQSGGGKPTAAQQAGGDLKARLEHASAAKGAKDARICAVCHNFKEGQGKKIGPDLWNVVGRNIASKPDFDYSSALKSKKGSWTYAELDKWLTKPSAFAHGTKMTYAGQSNPKKRADIIAYLRALSNSPKPLP